MNIDSLSGQISEDEQKVIEIMRDLNLNYEELKVLIYNGITPAREAIQKYKQPPWSKENVPLMDNYYHELEKKYLNLFDYLKETD